MPRNRHWWTAAGNGLFGEHWWKENLRMNRETFNVLCNELRPFIQKQVTTLRQPVSVETRVAVTVRKLATNVEYRTLSIGVSTVGNIVVETCHAITENLLPKCVYIPEGSALREVVQGFETSWGFPQVAGAIDGSHVPIVKPLESVSDYYNRKGFYSMVLWTAGANLWTFMSDGLVKFTTCKLFPPFERKSRHPVSTIKSSFVLC